MQDAVLRVQDVAHERRRLVLMVNRFRWEAEGASRVRTALRVETVETLQKLRWPSGEAVLNLLALEWTAPFLTLRFSDGIALRAACEVLDLVLEDVSDPWETLRRPEHPTDL